MMRSRFLNAIVLIGLFASPALAQMPAITNAAMSTDVDPTKASAALIQTELNDVTNEIQRQNSALDKWRMFSEDLKERLKRIDAEKESVNKRLNEISSKRPSQNPKELSEEEKSYFSSEVSGIINSTLSSSIRYFGIFDQIPQATIVDFAINKEKDRIEENIINIRKSVKVNKNYDECAANDFLIRPYAISSRGTKAEQDSDINLDSRYSSCLISLESIIKEGLVDSFYKKKIEIVSAAISAVDTKIKEMESSLKSLSAKRISLINALQKSTALSDQLLTWAAPGLGLIVIILLIAPRCYSADVQKTVFNTDVIIQLLTVFLLTTVILILGIAGKIPENALGTLLGGISGYVLGRTTNRTGNTGP